MHRHHVAESSLGTSVFASPDEDPLCRSSLGVNAQATVTCTTIAESVLPQTEAKREIAALKNRVCQAYGRRRCNMRLCELVGFAVKQSPGLSTIQRTCRNRRTVTAEVAGSRLQQRLTQPARTERQSCGDITTARKAAQHKNASTRGIPGNESVTSTGITKRIPKTSKKSGNGIATTWRPDIMLILRRPNGRLPNISSGTLNSKSPRTHDTEPANLEHWANTLAPIYALSGNVKRDAAQSAISSVTGGELRDFPMAENGRSITSSRFPAAAPIGQIICKACVALVIRLSATG